nr:PREDICTED: rhomboid domain-containing protein 3 [Lepisosteus oculatus]
MLSRFPSFWSRLGSNRSGFPAGTAGLLGAVLVTWLSGAYDTLYLDSEKVLPGLQVHRLWTYAFCHQDPAALLLSSAALLALGPAQERRWGSACFLALSLLSCCLPALLYCVLARLGAGGAGQVGGYSPVHFAMLAAQCHLGQQGRARRWLPAWALPWALLAGSCLLVPASLALLHLCAVCVGFSYSSAFLKWLQKGEDHLCRLLPRRAFVLSSYRDSLPVSSTGQRPDPWAEPSSARQLEPLQRSQWEEYDTRPEPWKSQEPDWAAGGVPAVSEVQLLEEQLLRAGILASLQDAPEGSVEKLELPKSSVSSLRLQQLERMGFPTEKAVVALAASGKLDGAISLLIDDGVGEEAVVTSKGRTPSAQWTG